MNPLSDNPKVRKIIYTIFWVWGLVLAGWQVAVASIPSMDQPSILTAMLAMFPVVSAYVGFGASQNVPEKKDEPKVDEVIEE